jgi:hypothetical protein
MNIHDDEGAPRAGLEHGRAVLLSERRLQKQLAALADQCPDHLISTESYPGRGRRFVARARPGTAARPWLVLTPDLDELRAALPHR